MQCRECGFNVGSHSMFCPACGARLVAADPNAAAAQAGVQSPSSLLGPNDTQTNPIVPPAVRRSGPAPQAVAPAGSAVSPAGASIRPAAPPAARPAVPVPAQAGVPARGAGPGAKSTLPQPGDVLADRYRVEKFLGQGSLCNAYLCRDSKVGNREVVFKAMHARKASEPGLAESFLSLAESISKYDHRGIARTFEWGRIGNTPYYTMEWVSGVPLRMWLMERLTFENRVLPGLGMVRALLDTFEVIHERGCYGCLKPENVFVTLSGPVVMDFGVVGFLSPQEFEFNSYARRYLPYMAPEIRQDWSNLVPHSDYYSLGAVLYEVLAGRAPTSPLQLPSELSDLFDIESDEIILKAMAPKPLDRFGTLQDFRGAVESLQAALLGAQPQPGGEGSRTMQVASDASMVHNPDETFASPAYSPDSSDSSDSPDFPGPAAAAPSMFPSAEADLPSRPAEDRLVSPSWAREPVGERPLEVNPLQAVAGPQGGLPEAGDPEDEEAGTGGQARSSFTGTGEIGRSPNSLEGEAAHALRRFTRSPRSAFPEGKLHAPLAVGAEAGGIQAISPAGGWENLQGQPGLQAEGPSETEASKESVPAWLWIFIALAGCGMVVLSAYFGLMLPR